MRHTFALLLITAAPLAACAQQGGDFPSLAPRPIEQMSLTPPSRPTPVATPDAELDAKIAALGNQLSEAAAAFDPAADHAHTLVAAARSAGIGSGPWLDAQTALAELDGIRAQSTAAMSALDALAIARASALQAPYPALEALHARGDAQVDRESAMIAELQGQLSGS